MRLRIAFIAPAKIRKNMKKIDACPPFQLRRRTSDPSQPMQKKSTSSSAFFSPRALLILLLCAAACLTAAGTLLAFFRSEGQSKTSQRTLTFQERVAYQRAIEDVYWRHRIWPKERPDSKPSLDAVMS